MEGEREREEKERVREWKNEGPSFVCESGHPSTLTLNPTPASALRTATQVWNEQESYLWETHRWARGDREKGRERGGEREKAWTRERDREKERETGRETERKKERETGRKRERERNRGDEECNGGGRERFWGSRRPRGLHTNICRVLMCQKRAGTHLFSTGGKLVSAVGLLAITSSLFTSNQHFLRCPTPLSKLQIIYFTKNGPCRHGVLF